MGGRIIGSSQRNKVPNFFYHTLLSLSRDIAFLFNLFFFTTAIRVRLFQDLY